MIVQGAIVDAAGPRAAYVRFEGPRVAEVGQIGTDSTRGRIRRVRGIVVPPPVNAHTHLGDALSTREPPPGPLRAIVSGPDGWKFRLLGAARSAPKRRAMAAALVRMRREGIAATIDFREEGLAGVRDLRAAARRAGVPAVALGRPLSRPVDPGELDRLLELSDGIGLAGADAVSPADRRTIARACRALGKLFALHASESVREDPDDFLDPRPDLLVHLASATPEDLDRVATAGCAVAVCPRSNALFGLRPPIRGLIDRGIPVLLGTDNAMFHAPSIWRELEFAYVSARLVGRPVAPAALAEAAVVAPWRLLGHPELAEVAAGGPGHPLVVRLPADDPAYQIVCRTTEHLIVRPGSPRRSGSGA